MMRAQVMVLMMELMGGAMMVETALAERTLQVVTPQGLVMAKEMEAVMVASLPLIK